MQKIFIDTNILIDLISQREPHYKFAAQLFSLADNKKIELSLSALSIANTHYILSKNISLPETRLILQKVNILVTLLDLNEKIIQLSLNDPNIKDFEDGIQYYTAIENRQSVIISRNIRDFKTSKIPVMSAEDFIQIF